MESKLNLPLIIALSSLVLSIISRTRNTVEKGSSKVVLSFPEIKNGLSKVTNKSTKLAKNTVPIGKPAFDSTNVPTDYSSIDCFAVFIGGPEDTLHNKSCYNSTKTHLFQFGLVAGSAAKGDSITLEVPSGNDRYIRIYGMKKPSTNPSAACPSITNDSTSDAGFTGFSYPYFLGEVGRIQMSAGATVNVDVPVSNVIDSTQYIEDCEGMGGSSPGNNSGPYLRFEFSNATYIQGTDKYQMTKGLCYPVTPTIFENGGKWLNPSLNPVLLNNLDQITMGTFYSAGTCSPGTEISNLSIPSGTSSASAFFKPTVIGDALTFTNFQLVPSDPTLPIEFSPDHNQVQIGNKQIVLQGPHKLSSNAGSCIPYVVSLNKFEGGPLNDGSSYTLTLAGNASYYIDSSPGCSGATSINVSSNNPSTIYFKLMSPVNLDLGSIITNPNLESKSFPITNVGGLDITDSLEFIVEKPVIENQQCLPVALHLVNASGAASSAKNALDINVTVPQGQGQLYNDPNCSSPLGGSVSIPVGSFYQNFYLKLSTQAASLPINIKGSGYSLTSVLPGSPSVFTLNPISHQDNWSLKLYPPSFNGAEIIGTHEFDGGGLGTYKLIPFTFDTTNPGTSLECSNDSSTWTPCTTEIQGNSYKWLASDAVNGVQRYLRVNYNGNISNSVAISTTSLYGTDFHVMNCDATAAAGAGQTISNANAALAAVSVYCLPGNTTFTRSSGSESFIFSGSKMLIGHSSGTSILDGGHFVGQVISISGIDIGSGITIANLDIQNADATASKSIFISNAISTVTSAIKLNNISINLNSGASGKQAIYVSGTNDPDVSVEISHSKFVTFDPADILLHFENSSYISLEKLQLEVRNATALAVKVDAISSISLYNFSLKNSLISGNGSGVYASSNTTFDLANFEIKNSTILLSEAFGTGNAANYGIQLNNGMSSFAIENNYISSAEATPNDYLLGFFGSSSTGLPTNGNVKNNTFVQRTAGSKAIYASNSTGTVNVYDFVNNAISYAGSGVTSQYAVFSSSGGMNLSQFGSTPASRGGNMVCAGANGWAGNYTGTLLQHPFSFISLTTNSISSITGKCLSY
ncbi:MAG: hypothetical protein KDD45_01195 [Bdellovibrionales bacterium]|nr:hypothetical protein [Bdellovibrionales bacterium]